MNLKDALISTFLHLLEFAACIGAAFFVVTYFKLGSDLTAVIAGAVVDAVVAFCRKWSAIPLVDYVSKTN